MEKQVPSKMPHQRILTAKELLKAVADGTPGMMAYIGLDHRHQFVNNLYADTLHVSPETLVDQTIEQAWGHDHEFTHWVHLATKGSGRSRHISLSLSGDRQADVFFTATADQDQNGEVRGFVIHGFDVTSLKQTESALLQSEQRFQTVVNLVPQFIWTLDGHGKLQFCNERWIDYTGVTIQETEANGWVKIVHPDDLGPSNAAWAEAFKTGNPYECQLRLRRHDGIYRWFLARAIPVSGVAGSVEQWFGTTTDIEAQKRAFDHSQFLDDASILLASSLDLETTLNTIAERAVAHLADWVVVDLLDVETQTVRVAAVTHWDPRRRELVRSMREQYPPAVNNEHGLAPVLRDGRTLFHPRIEQWMLELFAQDQGQLKAWDEIGLSSAICVPLKNKDQVFGVLGLFLSDPLQQFDEDDLHLAEELARRASLAIENSSLYRDLTEKEAALKLALRGRDEFLSIASHELKTPVTSMKLQFQLASLMAERDDPRLVDPLQVRRRVDIVNQQLDRMSRLIDEMLDVSRLSTHRLPLKREPVDLKELAAEVVDRFALDFENRKSSVRFIANGSALVMGDRFRIEQVITNLLTNALKYGCNRPVTVTVQADTENAFLIVADQGIGIDPSDYERIFKRFERVDSSSNEIWGLGLGLYITERIVNAHGGNIRVESQLGRGSTFTVALPLSSEKEATDAGGL